MSIKDTISRAANGCHSGVDSKQETAILFATAFKTILSDIVCFENLDIGTLAYLNKTYGLDIEINDGRVSDIIFS